MKKVIALTGLLFMLIMTSCTNGHWSFPDFDYTTTYFPYQFPVRTLVLGDYYFDNSEDNELKFGIGAHMGGVYENKQNLQVGFSIDKTLVDRNGNGKTDLFNAAGGARDSIRALPASYYTLSNPSGMTIPTGSVFGMVDVQLTQAFLDDTLAIAPKNFTYYVIPLTMINSSADSILSGIPFAQNADPRIAAEWIKPPKNFTLYGIKYVNQYHGKYLLRGADVIKAADNSTIETIPYRDKYVERNTVVAVSTYRKNAVLYSNSIKRSTGSPGSFEMKITFDDTGNGTILNTTRYPKFTITGSAKFVKDAEEWGYQKRNVIYLDYSIVAGTETHNVKDTLVFRDKGVSFEEFVPKIVP
jgi:hypothetical protein